MTDAEVTVTDFRMAGFLLARGAKFLGTMVNDRKETVFRFNGTATEMVNEYPGSAEQKYDAACRSMHDFTKMNLQRKAG